MIKIENVDALIVGVDGLIGSALYQRLTALGHYVIGTSRRPNSAHLNLNLENFENFNSLPLARCVFICLGINGFNACEENLDLATKVNWLGTCKIARHYMMRGSHVIFYSSSSVFGSHKTFPVEVDLVNPNTHYGRLKVAAEHRMMEDAFLYGAEKLTIIRLTKVLESLTPLVNGWINKSRLGVGVDAFDDLYLCPISLEFILTSTLKICEKGFGGVFHLSGNQIMSYYDFAKFHQENGVLLNCQIVATPSNGLPKSQVNQCVSLGMDATKRLLSLEPEALKAIIPQS